MRGADTVLTFEPHPLAVVAPDAAPRLLTSLEAKADLVAGLGVASWSSSRSTAPSPPQSPQEFIDHVLVERLGAELVSVGENFRFGHRARGDAALLRAQDGVRDARGRARRGRRRGRVLEPHPRAGRGGRHRARRAAPRRPVRGARRGRPRRHARAHARLPDGQPGPRPGARLPRPRRLRVPGGGRARRRLDARGRRPPTSACGPRS